MNCPNCGTQCDRHEVDKTQENHPSNQINDCWGVNYADWLIRKACWLHAIFSNSLCLRSRHQMLHHLNVSFVLRFP